jgi:hypothetical protein
MAKHKVTQAIVDIAYTILADDHPMTVRQVYYQLVARQIIKNQDSQYKRISRILVDARKDGAIPWDWIEDRLRRPRAVSMWEDLTDFGTDAVQAYRRNVWTEQPRYFETWLEKDALSGIFEDLLRPYGVTLNVGRGYDGWDSIRNAAQRMGDGRRAAVLYFGDFDPSGEDMKRSLEDRLAYFGCMPDIVKCALTAEDIARYQLPPDPAKRTDTRAAEFIAKNGDISVELDALPGAVLRQRIRQEVEARLDMSALEATRRLEATERQRLISALASG